MNLFISPALAFNLSNIDKQYSLKSTLLFIHTVVFIKRINSSLLYLGSCLFFSIESKETFSTGVISANILGKPID